MQVILLRDVPKVGKKNDVKNVSDGYGRNFLLKNGLAELATSKSLKTAEMSRAKLIDEKIKEDALLKESLNKLSLVELILKGKSNDEGVLFAGIKELDVSNALESQAGLTIGVEYIKLEKPIKTIGRHEILVAAGEGTTKLWLTVEKEE